MKVNCVICGELATQNQVVSAAPCGHTFHTECLLQWLERSKTCPQCRSHVTEKKIKRLFFDPGSAESEIDPDLLQQQIDNLKFQIKLKEQEAKKVNEKNSMLEAQAVALREEYKSVEKKLRDKEVVVSALKTQVKHIDHMTEESKKAKEQVKKLVEDLNLLRGVEKMIKGTQKEVEAVLKSDSTNQRSLSAFISALKTELSRVTEDKRKLKAEVVAATRECLKAKASAKLHHAEVELLSTSLKQEEEDNRHLEKENAKLRKKVQDLERAIVSPSEDVRNSALHRLLFESPAPEVLKKKRDANLSEPSTSEVSQERDTGSESESEASDTAEATGEEGEDVECIDLTTPSPMRKKKKANPFVQPSLVSASPSLTPVRPLADNLNIVNGTKKLKHLLNDRFLLSSPALKASKRKLGSNVGYDGLGGHHAFDEFPKPSVSLRTGSRKKIGANMKAAGVRVRSAHIKKGPTKPIQDYFKNTFDDFT